MYAQLQSAKRCSWAVTLIGLLVLTAPGAWASESEIAAALAEAKTKRAREAQIACELVAGLEFNRGQARRLMPIVEEAAELHLDAYDQQARMLPEMLDSFGDFAREDSLNQGFTRAVERKTARLNHQAKEMREKFVEDLAELEKLALAALTDWQRERVESLTPDGKLKRNDVRRDRGRRRHTARARRVTRQNKIDQRLRTAREELTRLHQEIYGVGKLGVVGHFLLHPAAGEPLRKIAGVRASKTLMRAARAAEYGTSEYPIALRDEHQTEIARLRGEISSWNLINGLHLSREQTDRIVGLYESAVPRGAAANAKKGRRGGVTPFLLVSAERSVEQIMYPGQRQVVADFKTCLIPPKNLKDPVRVGQAADHSRYERWLDRARKADHRRLTAMIDRTLKEEAEHLGRLSPSEERERRALMIKTARQIAKLPDAEFELSKAELAEKVAPRDRKEELKDEIAVLARERGQPGPVARHMLKPRFIEQLRLRGQQLAQGVVTESADLTAGPQAENCEKGCAIDGSQGKKKKKK